jgi:hypothetical protein
MNHDRQQRIDRLAACWLRKTLRPHRRERPAEAVGQKYFFNKFCGQAHEGAGYLDVDFKKLLAERD